MAPRGRQHLGHLEKIIADRDDDRLPPIAREVMQMQVEQLRDTDQRIAELERQLLAWHKRNDDCQRLATIPGVGPMTATALVATIGDAKQFKNGRQMAAWMGLTPLENSTGGKARPGRMSKRGDGYLRRLLIHGSRAVVGNRKRAKNTPAPKIDSMLKHKHPNIVAVATANRNARVAWSVLTRKQNYKRVDMMNTI